MKHTRQNGFTVVETLIVIAVTGMMFASVSLLVRGQISKAQYKDGAFQLQSMVNDVINDVQTGYYPNMYTGSTDCTGAGQASSGKSTSCVIAGKRLTFNANNLTIETLAVSSSLTAFSTTNGDYTSIGSVTEVKPYPHGFSYTGSFYPGGGSKTATAVSQNVLYSFYGTATPSTVKTGSQMVGIYNNSYVLMTTLNSGNGQRLCFTDGVRNASIDMGTKASPLAISINMDDPSCI